MNDLLKIVADYADQLATAEELADSDTMTVAAALVKSVENGRALRFALAGGALPGDDLELGLDDTLLVCSGRPFGGDVGRLVTLGSLTANDLRLIVFDMASGADHSDYEVRCAAATAVAWIAALGGRAYGQWLAFDVQRTTLGEARAAITDTTD